MEFRRVLFRSGPFISPLRVAVGGQDRHRAPRKTQAINTLSKADPGGVAPDLELPTRVLRAVQHEDPAISYHSGGIERRRRLPLDSRTRQDDGIDVVGLS